MAFLWEWVFLCQVRVGERSGRIEGIGCERGMELRGRWHFTDGVAGGLGERQAHGVWVSKDPSASVKKWVEVYQWTLRLSTFSKLAGTQSSPAWWHSAPELVSRCTLLLTGWSRTPLLLLCDRSWEYAVRNTFNEKTLLWHPNVTNSWLVNLCPYMGFDLCVCPVCMDSCM